MAGDWNAKISWQGPQGQKEAMNPLKRKTLIIEPDVVALLSRGSKRRDSLAEQLAKTHERARRTSWKDPMKS